MRGAARSQEDLDASRRGMWCALLGALARERLYALADGVRQACPSPPPLISRLRLRLRLRLHLQPPPPPSSPPHHDHHHHPTQVDLSICLLSLPESDGRRVLAALLPLLPLQAYLAPFTAHPLLPTPDYHPLFTTQPVLPLTTPRRRTLRGSCCCCCTSCSSAPRRAAVTPVTTPVLHSLLHLFCTRYYARTTPVLRPLLRPLPHPLLRPGSWPLPRRACPLRVAAPPAATDG